jgi:hypothetical protein
LPLKILTETSQPIEFLSKLFEPQFQSRKLVQEFRYNDRQTSGSSRLADVCKNEKCD